MLSNLLKSLFGRFSIHVEEIIVVGLVQSVYLVENNSEETKAVELTINRSQGFAHILPFVLHRKKSVSDYVKTVGLDQRPKLYNLSFFLQSSVVSG